MAPTWGRSYKLRRATNILSYAVRQNWEALNLMGESCYLLQRKRRADSPIHSFEDRRVPTITVSVSGGYTVDPDTGAYRYKLWGADTHPVDEYPDIGVLTCTVQASASTDVWETAVDKYSFIDGRAEIAFDIFQDQIDSSGDDLEDAMYVVFNTPPFTPTDGVVFVFGTISPAVRFESMQPIRDNQTGFQHSLFSFDQWLKASSVIRSRSAPNQFLLAFPGVLSDITITAGGLLQESSSDYWTVVPPYSPAVVEHDVIIRKSTGERYQAVNYAPIYIEDILVSQHFDAVLLDPRSSLYNIPVI